jgi:hypothetical protein
MTQLSNDDAGRIIARLAGAPAAAPVRHLRPARTWNEGKRCAACCSGDRCDDPSHYSRERCPHCMGTGWAVWTVVGREDYVQYLQGWRGMSEQEARAAVAALVAPGLAAS